MLFLGIEASGERAELVVQKGGFGLCLIDGHRRSYLWSVRG